jgi:hypothetical protein
MEQLKALSDFFVAIENDPRISITHIGIYAALLQYWQKHEFSHPVIKLCNWQKFQPGELTRKLSRI